MAATERWMVAWQQRAVLMRIARSRVPTREDAEDVVAEAIRRAGTQEDLPLDAVPAWLTRVTVNLCTDRQRRLATQRTLLTRAELRPDVESGPEAQVTDRAEATWIAAQLGTLPERQARVLRLRADGQDNAAIAAMLGVTVATVEGLLKRSRAALRNSLRAVGLLLGILSARSLAGRRAAALTAVAMVTTLLLLPWQAPLGESAPPNGSLPRPSADRAIASVPLDLTGVGGQLVPDVGVSSRSGDAGTVDPKIGQAPPYDGPHCLAAYCLPVVDAAADQSLGSERPQGWSPADLQDYFGEPAWAPSAAARRPVVAVLSYGTFDWIEDDLAVYRSTFHLPPCTSDSGCLQFADPPDAGAADPVDHAFSRAYVESTEGQARAVGVLYGGNPGAEQAQMLQGVSAACPECRLLLVRAATSSLANYAAAFRAASQLDPDLVLTNFSAITPTPNPLDDPAIYGDTLTLVDGGVHGFTGDGGLAPRNLPGVIGVGGTVVNAGRVDASSYNESFCSPLGHPPAWQANLTTGCAGRAGVDLAAPGQAKSGLAVYISGGLPSTRGWYHPGYNLQAVAIVGGLFARHNLSAVVRGPADLYAHPEWFADIVHGNSACTTANVCEDAARFDATGCQTGAPQLCHARRGFDGPTGLGEPRYLPWF